MTNIHPYQILNGQQIHGGKSLVEREHFYTALQDDPVTMMETVNAVMDFNLGETLASQIASRAVERIPAGSEGYFRWAINYFVDGNYECIGVYTDSTGTTEMTAADKLEARTLIYMDFQGAPFGHTEVISGMNPENDLLLIKEVINPSPGVTRYAVEMAYSSGPESFFSYEQVATGTRWAKSYGAVSDRMSYDGFGVNFKTPVMAEGHMSSFRMKFQFHGKDVNWSPKYFYLPDKNGKVTNKSPKLWMTTVEYEFLAQIRKATANALMYGRSNKWKDGTWGNYDQNNGYEIRMGSGWNEQKLSSNRRYYAGAPSLKEIEELILAAVVNRTGQRKVIIKAGEYGLIELSKMVLRAYGSGSYVASTAPWATDTTGRNIKWSGNDVFINMGQVRGVALMAGIECQFVLDPLKDDPARNNVKMPGLPGFASSYEYDIVGFGNTTEDSNMRIIRREGEEPIFASVDGIRGGSLAKQATSFANPSRVATGVDMFELHYYDTGFGAKLADPTGWISYYPNFMMYKF